MFSLVQRGMDNLESSLLELVSSVMSVSKKRELRVNDLTALSKQAEAVKGSFQFAKRLVNEITTESAASVEKQKTTEEELNTTRKAMIQDQARSESQIKELKEQIEQLTKERNDLSSSLEEVQSERTRLQESATMMKEEMQKSYLTISAYEEQILRLNQQLSIESLEKQKKEGEIWTPSKMIHLLGERINNEESVYYWAAKVRSVIPPLS